MAIEGLPSALDIATLRLCIACTRHLSCAYKTILLEANCWWFHREKVCRLTWSSGLFSKRLEYASSASPHNPFASRSNAFSLPEIRK